jgi:uncharacterized protein GlcG (DUF336 family)
MSSATKRLVIVAVAVVAVGGLAWVAALRATPASGFSANTVVQGTFSPMHLKNEAEAYDWEIELESKGQTQVYVQSNTWAAKGDPNFPNGGSSGWHTHPGFSLITVTQGTLTVYDDTCTPSYYSAGKTFVDAGGSHVHLIRNDGTTEAKGYAVQFVPTAVGSSGRRVDVPAPCSF